MARKRKTGATAPASELPSADANVVSSPELPVSSPEGATKVDPGQLPDGPPSATAEALPPTAPATAEPPTAVTRESAPTPALSEQARKARRGAIAVSCLPAILCGIAVTMQSVQFDRGVMLWVLFVVAAGLILRYPDKDRWDEAFKRATPAAVCFVASIVLIVLIKLLFVWLSQASPGSSDSKPIATNPAISANPIFIAGIVTVIGLVVLAVLLVVFFVATALGIALTSVGSELIVEGANRFITIDPARLRRADVISKLIIALVGSGFLLWHTLLG